MKILPKIKKDVKEFLSSEDGNISKKSIIRVGTILSIVALASVNAKEVLADRSYTWFYSPDGCCVGIGPSGCDICHSNSQTKLTWSESRA